MDRASKIQPKLTDKELVRLFVGYLAHNGSLGLTVNVWPDERNRQSSDIDAIAGPFAIEHSSIDSIPNQRRDAAWFVQVIKVLEDEFRCNLPFRLILTFQYEAVKHGQDWPGITNALRVWVLNEAPRLAMGSYNIQDIPGIPFKVQVKKRSSDHTGLFFGRFATKDQMFPDRLKEQLARKADKLSRYKNEGKTTILLMESADIALMDNSIMWDGLQQACPGGLPQGVDQIWFADTSIRDEILFTDMTLAVIR